MIDRIQNRILSLLAADSVNAGGTAYVAGWTGIKSVWQGDNNTSGYVNLHIGREKQEPNRPAVYMGTKQFQYQDAVYQEAVNSVGIQFRRLAQPLVVVCKDATGLQGSQKQTEQLMQNVAGILMKKANRVQSGYWMCLTVKGKRLTESATGSGSSDAAEARGIVEIEVLYSWSPTSDA